MNEIIADLRVLSKDIWYHGTKYIVRAIKGYDERDLWGLDPYVARRVLPALKAFRKQKLFGHPTEFKNHEQWLIAIDEMIYGLGQSLKDGHNKRSLKGLELFGKYLPNLWD